MNPPKISPARHSAVLRLRLFPAVFAVFGWFLLTGNAQDPTPALAAVPASTPEAKPAASVETLVFLRHGEKPPGDSGQLAPRGLNRALALPAVLAARFGRPDYLFAPCTTKKTNQEGTFSYVRPLATIEPTAVRLGMPVETRFAYQDTDGLEKELAEPRYRGATVFIAWEHKELVTLVRHLTGAAADVPKWESDDYDSLYVVTIRTGADGAREVKFKHEQEGLDGLSDEFPEPKRK